MSYKFFLTQTEYNELATKYAEEYGPDIEIPSVKEFQEMYEDIHQRAFKRILPAMLSEEHKTFKMICDKLKEFEWQILRRDYTDCICLGIESDSRIEGVARQVERFLTNAGYELEEEREEEKEEKPIAIREVKKEEVKEDPTLDLAKVFYKALGDFIEVREKKIC